MRRHWAVENSLHWVLDMTFRDDECRVRTQHAPANFITVKHMAHNLIRRARGKERCVSGEKSPPGTTTSSQAYCSVDSFTRFPWGTLTVALTSYRASLAIADRPAKADQGNAGWQRDLSLSHIKIGDVQQAQGDLAAAHHLRPAGESGPGQRWLAARPVGVPGEDRRGAAGAGDPAALTARVR